MKRVTQTAILARAISDCTVSVRDAKAKLEAFGSSVGAVFYHDIVRPLEEELATLKTLYEIETGNPYEIDPAD